MFRSLILLLVAGPQLFAANPELLRYGPFQVLSRAGDRTAREKMMYLAQFRNALGVALGKQDPQLLWPVRVVVYKRGSDAQPGTETLGLARDAYVGATIENSEFSAAFTSTLARYVIESNTNRLPLEIENGLVELFSTLQVDGTHVTLGQPPAKRTRDWARMHLLCVRPEYAARAHVFISNLQQGADLNVAYRNAIEKNGKQIEAEVTAYLQAGAFGTIAVSAAALNPTRDFKLMSADADDWPTAEADLLLASHSPKAEAAFLALHGSVGAEGLGLIALDAGKKEEARRLLASTVESGSKSALAYADLALLEPDQARARKDLEKAGELNPRWAEVPYRLAHIETDPERKAAALKKAGTLDPRQPRYWQELAQVETDANHFQEAQKAWAGAERAAATDEEREHIHQLRLDVAAQRADFERAERKRAEDERIQENERARNAMVADVRAAEAAANKKSNPDGTAAPKTEDWWDEAGASSKVTGTLKRFDCLGKVARLVVAAPNGRNTQILVRDPAHLPIAGATETSFACGTQAHPRKVIVEYRAKPDKRLGTAGEAVSIAFQ